MRSVRTAVSYGLLVWVLPFVVAMVAFPLREDDRPFFESIMPVAVTCATVAFTVLYFRRVERSYVREGVLLGAVFFGISVAIDLLMFSRGPMAMSFVEYVKDVGFTYLLIPAITVGVGFALAR
ncbi:MAG: hypothetical protein CL878_07225 [Dehalococcoidia bacterium]|nr:hypothetical protein [Dehalococcoidia bacterium]